MEPDARISAGIQKRAKNLAAEELLIEVIAVWGESFSVRQGLNIPFTDAINIKSTLEVMMFGWGSAFLLPSNKKKEQTKDVARGGLMRLFTPFTIPKKENCDLCRIQKNKKKVFENHLLDNLFRNLYRQRFDFVFD